MCEFVRRNNFEVDNFLKEKDMFFVKNILKLFFI